MVHWLLLPPDRWTKSGGSIAVEDAQNLLAQSLIGRQPPSRTQIEIAAERREDPASAFQDRGQRRHVVIFQRGGLIITSARPRATR